MSIWTPFEDAGRPRRGEVPRRLLDRPMTTGAVAMPLTGPGRVIDHLPALQIPDVPIGSDG